MRKWISIAAVLLVAAAGYGVWPLVGLYRIGTAVHSADAEEALRRIDVDAVQQSLVRQILDQGAAAAGIARIGPLADQLLQAAAGALDDRAERAITAEVLRRLIAQGEFQPAGTAGGAAAAPVDAGFAIARNPLRSLQDFRFSSFITAKLVLGEDGAPDEWVGLTLRRTGLTWRLTDIRLSEAVLKRIRPAVQDVLD